MSPSVSAVTPRYGRADTPDRPAAPPLERGRQWILTGLPEGSHRLLDEGHALAKPELVGRGLMLAQCHPDCDERAARNPEFEVSRSPVPMLAMRWMAFHDVLFLDSDPEWFTAYEERYGGRHERGSIADPLFAEARDKSGTT